MKIGIDIMGGDFAPDATISGAILAYNELPKEVKLVLIGDESQIRAGLCSLGVCLVLKLFLALSAHALLQSYREKVAAKASYLTLASMPIANLMY